MNFTPPSNANVVVMFPYPSGVGLHVGHFYNYAIIDSYCRYWRYRGKNINQPFGYDAFGLPAENYARKIGGDPKEVTYQNIENFRKQMEWMNTGYEEKLTTSDPSYYKWTQWVFTKLYENNLAYKKEGEVNWCDSCKTVLANEQVHQNGCNNSGVIHGFCDRCGAGVIKRCMNQWYFKITEYKDRLIKNLDWIDYPAGTIKLQKNWLENLHDWCVSRQRSWGCPIPIEGETDTLDTFVDSSFYYLRYLTSSDSEFLPKEAYRPVDLYIGGAEHACMHLIYARFIHMFLYDIGIVPQEEPFNKVIHQGMITKDGAKISKSKGNTIDIQQFQPSELRLALMFIGPYFEGGDWCDQSIVGVAKFVKKLRAWFLETGDDEVDLSDLKKSIELQMSTFRFNLVVSTFMSFLKKNKNKRLSVRTKQEFLDLFYCFYPEDL